MCDDRPAWGDLGPSCRPGMASHTRAHAQHHARTRLPACAVSSLAGAGACWLAACRLSWLSCSLARWLDGQPVLLVGTSGHVWPLALAATGFLLSLLPAGCKLPAGSARCPRCRLPACSPLALPAALPSASAPCRSSPRGDFAAQRVPRAGELRRLLAWLFGARTVALRRHQRRPNASKEHPP